MAVAWVLQAAEPVGLTVYLATLNTVQTLLLAYLGYRQLPSVQKTEAREVRDEETL